MYIQSITTMSKKEQIFDTMLKLIAENGIYYTPMSAVAEKGHVAVGTIYHYFKSKDELLNALYLNVQRDLAEVLLNSVSDGDDIKESFKNMWVNLYRYYIDKSDAFMFIQRINPSNLISNEVKEECKLIYMPIVDFFYKAIMEEVFVNMNIQMMTEMFFASVSSVAQLQFLGGLEITEDLLNDAANAQLKAFVK